MKYRHVQVFGVYRLNHMSGRNMFLQTEIQPWLIAVILLFQTKQSAINVAKHRQQTWQTFNALMTVS